MTPAGRSYYWLVSRRCTAGLSNCHRVGDNVLAAARAALFPTKPQHPQVKPATLRCPPVDDGRFKRNAVLTRHIEGGSQLRGC